MRTIAWLRRDLRVRDNTALWHAARDAAGEAIPAITLGSDGVPWGARSPAAGAFARASIAELSAKLRKMGSGLTILTGDPLESLAKFARRVKADAVYYNLDADDPPGTDLEVEKRLSAAGVKVRGFGDRVIFGHREILTQAGEKPYVIFSQYRKAWLARARELGLPAVLGLPKLGPLPPEAQAAGRAAPSDGKTKVDLSWVTPGETAGARQLAEFVDRRLANYAAARNLPAVDGTSRLSAHLAMGTVSVRQCFSSAGAAGASDAREAAGVWLSEMIWREFFHQVLRNFPQVRREPFRHAEWLPRLGGRGPLFDAWCWGMTGYPIVDAAQRCLAKTGWMHNRLRMVSASFLAKDLLIDYRLGEEWFLGHLADGDVAQNNGNWQWCAGMGTDAQPWIRVFNPVVQGQKFDPDGVFVKQWCPELEHFPREFVHCPWLMPAMQQALAGVAPGGNYPRRVVDHAMARNRALAMARKG